MNTTILTFFTNYAGSLEYVVHIVLFALLCAVIFGYGSSHAVMRHMTLRVWAVFAVLWAVAYATALTVGQYVLWAQSDVTRELLQTPLSADTPRLLLHTPVFPFVDGAHGYYIFYAYTHFWVPVLLAILSAWVVYGLFAFLQKRKPVAVAYEEAALATGVAFLVGWPNTLIFMTLAFTLAALHTALGHVRNGAEARTRMVRAIVIAGLVTLTLGVYLGTQVGIGAMVV